MDSIIEVTMVKYDIAGVAIRKDKAKSSYELQNLLAVTPRTAIRLWRGQMNSITNKMIDLLCRKLECLPGDFIVYESDKKKSKK